RCRARRCASRSAAATGCPPSSRGPRSPPSWPSGRRVAERRYYPIFVDMTARPCLVVGGGAVAERKVEGLLEAGARVTVVSPTLARAIREELESYFTDDYAVLARIAAEVRAELRARGGAASGAEWRRALADLRPLIVAGRHADARRLLLERLEAARCA